MTVDDQERMMKMRAVPDDFDNLQALHSPYGAVHGTGTPLPSPVDYASSYGERLSMRPLMADTIGRRETQDQHSSSTGLSPAFRQIGFPTSGSTAISDLHSPLSHSTTDRYYGSHGASPLSSGQRTVNPFHRQSLSDNYPILSQSRNYRPLQPLQVQDNLSRSRSQSLQSPLRSSMSWKGEGLDYTGYLAGSTSTCMGGNQPPQYDSNSYSS